MNEYLYELEKQYEVLAEGPIKLVIDKMTDPTEMTGDLPAYLFQIVKTETNEVVGECDFRIGNNNSIQYCGHIGYMVDEAHRGNHYAFHALNLLLILAKKHQYSTLLVTSNPSNVASIKTIEKAKGHFLRIVDVPKDHGLYRHGQYKMAVYEFII